MIVDENELSEEDEVLVPPIKRIKKIEDENNIKEEKKSSVSLLLQGDDEDDEEDAPLPGSTIISDSSASSSVQVASQEFTDSVNAIQLDCWDVFSWITYIEEVEQNNGGSVTITEAYSNFLNQFKKATKFWKTILDYHIKNSQWALAEDLFNKCLLKCRNVDIWKSYLTMVRKRTIDTIPKPTDQYLAAERKRLENAFEKALENISYSCDSEEIWRLYIDFIREGSDSNIISGGYDKKLVPLRKIYQRALSIPMEGLDTFWKEYESLERTAGGDNQHLADKVLPEYNEKYLHAKTIYKDRKRYTNKISFDRLATPPSKVSIYVSI
jgi:cleavage stimulation factor subunit 3